MNILIDDEENGYYLADESGLDAAAEEELRILREGELELELEIDEHPDILKKIMAEVAEEHKDEYILKKDIKAIAIERIEAGARELEDFAYVVSLWDKADANREHKERYHEVGRGNVPLDYGSADDPRIFPVYLNSEIQKNLMAGDFITAIFDCPFEIHELVSNRIISQALYMLKPEHKEILHFHLVRKYNAMEIAKIREQSDRNIRGVYHTAIGKVRKNMLKLKFQSERISGLVKKEIKDEADF